MKFSFSVLPISKAGLFTAQSGNSDIGSKD